MPDNPTLAAYSVALFFEGAVALATIIAGSEAEAVAQVSVQTARQHDKPLVGIGVMRLEAEWMRFAMKTLESGEPHKAPVVSLVSNNERQASWNAPLGSLVSDNLRPGKQQCCPAHPWVVTAEGGMESPCPICIDNRNTARCTCPGYGPTVDIYNTDRDCPLHGVKSRIGDHLMPAEAPDPA